MKMASLSSSTLEIKKPSIPSMSLAQNPKTGSSLEEGIDRISDLPEPLQCHILSFLTTKEAAATSTLSTKWRNIWTAVPIIDLQHKVSPSIPISRPRGRRFSSILKHVFSHRTTHTLKKLQLKSRNYTCNPKDIMKWLKLAMDGEVEEIDLSFLIDKDIHLPKNLFTCKTLVVLKLSGYFNLVSAKIPSNVNLPNLRTLDLSGVRFTDVSLVAMILTGCPVLEYFSVNLITRVSSCSFKVSKPFLKKLIVTCLFCVIGIIKLEIDAPSLEFLGIEAFCIQDYELKNVQSVVEARINIYAPLDSMFNVFKALSGVKFMTLPFMTSEVFTTASNNLNLPEFGNLVHLEISMSGFDSRMFVRLLQKCPNLEILTVQKQIMDRNEPLCWIEPTIVPDCVSSKLTKFTFKGYRGYRNELRLVAYILRTANFLKKVRIEIFISLKWMNVKAKVEEQLSVLPRASSSCELWCIKDETSLLHNIDGIML